MLNVYSHNASYDFYSYANFTDKNLKWYSHRPFIVTYVKNGKEIIKFLDTMNIYRGSLKKVGETIGLEKLELPKDLQNIQDKKELIPYLIRDTEIVMESIQYIKNKLKQEKIGLKRLYTINQIAIQYLISKLKKLERHKIENIFYNIDKGMIYRPNNANDIHKAYRGGKVEAYKTGIHENVTYIDFNSLYPYSCMIMDMPNLKTEKLTKKPLELGLTKQQILKKIGIVKAFVKNNSDELEILPIRTNTGNYFPKKGKYLIGVWTTEELKYATQYGYNIIDIEWVIHYQKQEENPFKEIMTETYNMRKKSTNKFDDYFYKMMMNAGIGKLAQRKKQQEYVLDSVEKAEEYLENKYKIVQGLNFDYMYKKEVKGKPKKYYCPIIPTLVTAKARIIMHGYMNFIPKEDLIYTDTDSIIFKGNHTKKFDIGNNIGQFKIEHQNKKIIIYGKKTYKIGTETKVSGFNKRDLKDKDFEKGIITNKKMNTILTTNNINLVGKFVEDDRNLNNQKEQHKTINQMYDKELLFIDSDIDDIRHFLPKFKETFI